MSFSASGEAPTSPGIQAPSPPAQRIEDIQTWQRIMRALWLFNSVEVGLAELRYQLVRMPGDLRALAQELEATNLSEDTCAILENELVRVVSHLAQAIADLEEGKGEARRLLKRL